MPRTSAATTTPKLEALSENSSAKLREILTEAHTKVLEMRKIAKIYPSISELQKLATQAEIKFNEFAAYRVEKFSIPTDKGPVMIDLNKLQDAQIAQLTIEALKCLNEIKKISVKHAGYLAIAKARAESDIANLTTAIATPISQLVRPKRERREKKVAGT